MLAFFVPGVVYMADAVGTQTEAVVIRGLSVGVPMRAVSSAGAAHRGDRSGSRSEPRSCRSRSLAWGDAQVAVAVALALLASCSIATILAMALPWMFQRFGSDRRSGSGPLATVVQDLVSIAVYSRSRP